MKPREERDRLLSDWLDELNAHVDIVKHAHRDWMNRQPVVGAAVNWFWRGMYSLAACVQRPLEDKGSLDKDSVETAKLYLVVSTFHLLLTTFDATLAGRFGAAANNSRSVSEAPAYLLALHFDPSFRAKWAAMERPPLVKHARDAAERGLEKIQPGSGNEWRLQQEQYHAWVQPFSHVNRFTTLAHLRSASGHSEVGFAGVTDYDKLEAYIYGLLLSTLQMIWACRFAMANMLPQPSDWEATALETYHTGQVVLAKMSQEFQAKTHAALRDRPELEELLRKIRRGPPNRGGRAKP